MAKKEANENYVHACGLPMVDAKKYINSISCAGYSDIEFKKIIEFYVFNAPILKSDKTDLFGLKSLKDYGWHGNSDMSKLERELLKAGNMSSLCFVRSSSIELTLNQMLLGTENWCISHPRAVLKQEYNCDARESGKAEISNKESRMECLFRHIRNSLAHNHVYVFDNENIVLEDTDAQNGKITARILLNKSALLEWIRITRKEPITTSSFEEAVPEKAELNCNGFRKIG